MDKVDFTNFMMDIKKAVALLERIANTLVDIETLLEQSAQRSLTPREAARGQICPSCGEREVFASGILPNVRCFACEWTGQI